MKTRIIYPQLWHDSKFCECSIEAKTLFMFIITNPYLGLSRYSRLSDRQIAFHTGLSGKKLETAKNELSILKWCFFSNEWVYHNHNCAYVEYEGNSKVATSKESEISNVPQEIKEVINGLLTGYQPNINYKSKTINQKGIVKGESSTGGAVAEHLISVFNQATGKNYSPTSKRCKLISDRLGSFPSEQLEKAAMNVAKSPFHMGKNDRGWSADPDWLFRNDENVDKMLNLEVKEEKKPLRLGYKAVTERSYETAE